ncbi:MAG: T9SS type A sorting domain-containing protein [Ignavibacteriae bacterium]|nr:T9SS type A sorting domain-containing protein [Ignavibacteriota bacterium]
MRYIIICLIFLQDLILLTNNFAQTPTYSNITSRKAHTEPLTGSTYNQGVVLKGRWYYSPFSWENHGVFRQAIFSWGYSANNLPNTIVAIQDNSLIDWSSWVWTYIYTYFQVNLPLVENTTIYYTTRCVYEHQVNGQSSSISSITKSINYIDNTPPAVPTNLQVSETQDEHPKLTWNANTEPDINNYRVYRKRNSEAWVLTGTTSSTTFTDFDVTTTYLHGDDIYYKISALDVNGNSSGFSSIVWIEARLLKEVIAQDISSKPNEFNLRANYPNPFNPTTTITYEIPYSSKVNLNIYDIQGNMVAKLVDESKSAGVHSIQFNASNIPSGVYFYKLTAGNNSDMKKMLFLK